MPRYRTPSGIVVDRDTEYVSAFPEGTFVPVDESTSLSVAECCGGEGYQDSDGDDDPDKKEDE